MDRDRKEWKLWEIWMEGYRASGEHGTAQKIGEYWANSFDEAVEQHPKSSYGPDKFTKSNFTDEEAYNNRRSNWNIWACALFDTEEEARQSFG